MRFDPTPVQQSCEKLEKETELATNLRSPSEFQEQNFADKRMWDTPKIAGTTPTCEEREMALQGRRSFFQAA